MLLPQPFCSFRASLALSPGRSGVFGFVQGMLTVFGAFLDVNASVSMLGTSVSPPNVSIQLPKPSVASTLHFASPAPRQVVGSSPLLIPPLSALFDAFRVSLWLLNASVWPSVPFVSSTVRFASPVLRYVL